MVTFLVLAVCMYVAYRVGYSHGYADSKGDTLAEIFRDNID